MDGMTSAVFQEWYDRLALKAIVILDLYNCGCTIKEAIEYKKMFGNADNLGEFIAEWRKYGFFQVEDISAWRSWVGNSPAVCAGWRDAGFEPIEAAKWYSIRIVTSQEAANFKLMGYTTETCVEYRKDHPVTPLYDMRRLPEGE